MGAQADAVRAEFDEFRRKARQVMIRVAGEQGYCDDGLNGVLRELGLPEKQTFRVPAELVITRQVQIPVPDAESLEEARERVRGDAGLRFARGLGYANVEAVRVEEPPAPAPATAQGEVPSAGDAKPAYGRFHSPSVLGRQCLEHSEAGNWCTRDRAHESPHVASDSRVVKDVWPGAGRRADAEEPQYAEAEGQQSGRGSFEDLDDDEDYDD